MNILILGGSGFLGTKIKKKLKSKHKVKDLSRSNGNDLRYSKIIRKNLKQNYDVIINCAAHVGNLSYLKSNKASVMSNNLKIYQNLYDEICHSNIKPHIINLISNCVYPGDQVIQKEKNIFKGSVHESVEPFGLPKLILLKLSLFYQEQYNINSLNLVLPNAFGPGDHLDINRSHALNGIIDRMIEAKKNNDINFEIWGSGKPKREWIFAEDVARIIDLTISKRKFLNKIKIINIAQNKSYSINFIAKEVKKYLKYKGKLINNKNLPDGAPIKQLDNNFFKKNYKNFKFSKFENALKKTINYYLKLKN